MSAPRTRTLACTRSAGAALLILGGGMCAVPASATPAPADSPCPAAGSGLDVHLDSPGPGAVVNLGRTPRFVVRGSVTGEQDDPVTGVVLYADGTRLADATLDTAATHGPARLGPRAHGGIHPLGDIAGRSWSYTTSAPPGRHVITACATTAAGRVASDTAAVVVHRPGPRATVVAPGAQRLSAGDAAILTEVTPSTMTFRRPPRMTVGAVVVAAPSALAPDGLLRRVTAITSDPTATVVHTVPAALTDVFWQAAIDVRTPLRTAAGPDAPTLDWSDTMAAGPGLNGARVAGTLALTGPAAYRADLTLDLHARIDADWAWTPTPAVHVTSGDMSLSGTTSADAEATFTGSGDLEIYADPDGKRQVAYPPIELSRTLPVWVRPMATLTLHARAHLADALTVHARATTTSAAGLHLGNRAVTPVRAIELAGRAEEAPTATAATAGDARLEATISVQLRADGVTAARTRLTSGFSTTAEPGCPGNLRVAAFATAGVTGSALLEPGLTDPAFGPGEGLTLRTDPFTTCPAPIGD